MKIYIGGYAQGKTEYVAEKYPEKTILEGAAATEEACMKADIINHFHLYLRFFNGDTQAALASAERIVTRNETVILICDEVGSGIVPLQKEEREYRELVGRVMCQMTAQAEQVVRIFCGIPVVIK